MIKIKELLCHELARSDLIFRLYYFLDRFIQRNAAGLDGPKSCDVVRITSGISTKEKVIENRETRDDYSENPP
jgi:hypothetical protein